MRCLPAILLLALCSSTLSSDARADLVMTGLMDGTIGTGSSEPTALEFYVNGTIDFSTTTLTFEQSAHPSFSFGSPVALSSLLGHLGSVTNSFVYLIGENNTLDFESIFGTSGDFANKAETPMSNTNGIPAYRLMEGATVVDQVGFANDLPYYRDGWMYRKDNTGPDGGFVEANFTFSGNNALDNLTPTQIADAVPFGSYTIASIPEPTALLYGGLVAGLLAAPSLRRQSRRPASRGGRGRQA